MNNPDTVFRVTIPWRWVPVVILCTMCFGWPVGAAVFVYGARWNENA